MKEFEKYLLLKKFTIKKVLWYGGFLAIGIFMWIKSLSLFFHPNPILNRLAMPYIIFEIILFLLVGFAFIINLAKKLDEIERDSLNE